MEIKQYYLGCLSHASYMVSDAETRSNKGLTPTSPPATWNCRSAPAPGCPWAPKPNLSILPPRREGDEIKLGSGSLRFRGRRYQRSA